VCKATNLVNIDELEKNQKKGKEGRRSRKVCPWKRSRKRGHGGRI